MKKKPDPLFKTEEELCAAFMVWVNAHLGWIAYAETEGWDVLCAHADGTQIGVQAKMRLNLKVLAQCVEEGRWPREVGPDFRAILVPENPGYSHLADALGITTIYPRSHWSRLEGKPMFEPDIAAHGWQTWHYRNPVARHELPRFVPDVPAGVPSPSPLTKWKIAALQIIAVLELRGYITRQDFRSAGIDHRRWVENWLEPVPEKPGAWRMLATAPNFAAQHPLVYPQVLAEVREKGLAMQGLLV